MSANPPKGLFVTGTDTGVGKTLVAAALAKVLRESGVKVGVMKPAETGISDQGKLGPDAKLLKWAADSQLSDAEICPYRLKAPLAPAVAASKENIRVDYNGLIQQAQQLIEQHDFTIIEGAGGLMVPLAGGFLIADYARALGLPLLVISRPNLGTINHTLLTLFSARNFALPVAGYILNRMPLQPGVAEETAAHSLASLTIDELLGVLPQVEGDDQQKVELLSEQIKRLQTRSLLEKYLPKVFQELD